MVAMVFDVWCADAWKTRAVEAGWGARYVVTFGPCQGYCAHVEPAADILMVWIRTFWLSYAICAVLMAAFFGSALGIVQGTSDINPLPASLSFGVMLSSVFCGPLLEIPGWLRVTIGQALAPDPVP